MRVRRQLLALPRWGLLLSMTSAGRNRSDDATAERLFAISNHEPMTRWQFKSQAQAEIAPAGRIEVW